MTSERRAFFDYLDALDMIQEGRLTVEEAVAHIERINGSEYAEIARASFYEALATGKPRLITGSELGQRGNA